MYFDPQLDGPLLEEQLSKYHSMSAGTDGLLSFEELQKLIELYADQMVEDSEGENGDEEEEEEEE